MLKFVFRKHKNTHTFVERQERCLITSKDVFLKYLFKKYSSNIPLKGQIEE